MHFPMWNTNKCLRNRLIWGRSELSYNWYKGNCQEVPCGSFVCIICGNLTTPKPHITETPRFGVQLDSIGTVWKSVLSFNSELLVVTKRYQACGETCRCKLALANFLFSQTTEGRWFVKVHFAPHATAMILNTKMRLYHYLCFCCIAVGMIPCVQLLRRNCEGICLWHRFGWWGWTNLHTSSANTDAI